MKIYTVEQGCITKSGCGDYHEVLKTDNLKEALQKFNEVKHDKRGWVNTQHCYLETMILKYDNEEDYEDGLSHDPLKYERIPF